MALNKFKALDVARQIIAGARTDEWARLDRIHNAMRPPYAPGATLPAVQIPSDAPSLMLDLARKSATNYLPLLVKSYRQVIKADGYYSASDDGAEDPWVWWQRNRMDSRQAGVVDSALKYGVGYGSVLPGTYGRGLSGPSISLYTPRELTALYQDPEVDEWPMLTLGVDGRIVTLLDETSLYRFGIETWVAPYTPPIGTVLTSIGNLTYIDTQVHDLGVTPVVRWRDRNLLCGEEQLGIVEPLLTIQERIDETTFQMQVAQYFQAFKQRYVLGWVPKSEQEELKAGAARIWYLDEDPADVKIEQLDAGAIQPYIDSRNSALRDLASTGQIPVQTLGIDGISNISDATLAGLEAAKNREAGEISTSLGESFEQMMRMCAHIAGNQAAADDYTSEIRWKDFEARSFAAVIDGISKEILMGVPDEIAFESLPGMTEQKLERIKAKMRSAQAMQVRDRLAAARVQSVPGNSPAPQ